VACASDPESDPHVAERVDAGVKEAGEADRTTDARTRDAGERESAADGHVTRDSTTDGNRENMVEAGGTTDGRLTDAAGPEHREGGSDPPSLVALSVTAPHAHASPPLGLIPAFSPAIHDYYVRCAAGTNALTVSMTASPGAESRLVQPTASPYTTTQTNSLSVEENQAVVAEATLGTATAQYWVRCLPHDFPPMEMNLHLDAGVATPGYYLIGNFTVLAGQSAYAMVLDSQGVPVWYYREPLANHGLVNVDSLLPGDVSFIPFPLGNGYEVHTLSPSSITYIVPDGLAPGEHDLQRLPNGNYLLFFAPVVSGVNLAGLSIPIADGGTQAFGGNSSIFACEILEVDPTGFLVWTWSALDHFDPVAALTLRTQEVVFPGPIVDPFHCNSVSVDTNGNLLVSARSMDSIFYVERSNGAVLWKMGGANSSKDNASYVPVADPFYRQHDARLQPNWSYACGGGQISMFDDETDMPNPARGVVYDVTVPPPMDGGVIQACAIPKDAGSTGVVGATVDWQYQGTASVSVTGSFRILPDGSRTIGWGFGGPQLAFSEVDVNGNDLLDFKFTAGDWSYRAIKVPLAQFDLNVLRSAVGRVMETNDGGAEQ
jgi:hypothetical protein